MLNCVARLLQIGKNAKSSSSQVKLLQACQFTEDVVFVRDREFAIRVQDDVGQRVHLCRKQSSVDRHQIVQMQIYSLQSGQRTKRMRRNRVNTAILEHDDCDVISGRKDAKIGNNRDVAVTNVELCNAHDVRQEVEVVEGEVCCAVASQVNRGTPLPYRQDRWTARHSVHLVS